MIFKYFLFGAVFFSVSICLAQQKVSISSEASILFLPKVVESPHYNIIESKKKLGYGGNLFCNYYFNKHLSSTLGARISYMNFYFVNDYYSNLFWNNIILRDISFPLLITRRTTEEKQVSFLISTGICWGVANPVSIVTKDSFGNNVFNQSTDTRMKTQYFSLIINGGFSWNIYDELSFFARSGFEFLKQGFYLPDKNFISGKTIENVSIGVMYRFEKKE